MLRRVSIFIVALILCFLLICGIFDDQIHAESPREPSRDKGQESAAKKELYEEEAKAVAIASEFYQRASEEEKAVTDLLKSLETESVHLVGLDLCLKSKESITRKLLSGAHDEEISLEEAREGIHDALRYTYCICEEKYTDAVKDILGRLTKQGYSVYKLKNFWEGDIYKGINAQLTTPGGYIFELQLHTPTSFYVKKNKTHECYETIRSESSAMEEIEEAIWKAIVSTAAIPIPKGALSLSWPLIARTKKSEDVAA